MKDAFARFAVKVSKVVGTPTALIVANGLVLGSIAVFGVNVTNIVISVATMDIALIIQATQNKDSTANHAKLDGIIDALEEADSDLERVEEEPEDVIEEKRPT
jgi:low affinity Fe/Cu permease